MRRDWYWLEDDGHMTRMKEMTHKRIRSLYPPPYLHRKVTVDMWAAWSAVLLAAIVFCGDWRIGRTIFGLASWVLIIAAIIQWLWWGRRSGNR
jgi:hypothetical protein